MYVQKAGAGSSWLISDGFFFCPGLVGRLKAGMCLCCYCPTCYEKGLECVKVNQFSPIVPGGVGRAGVNKFELSLPNTSRLSWKGLVSVSLNCCCPVAPE